MIIKTIRHSELCGRGTEHIISINTTTTSFQLVFLFLC